MMLVFFWVHQDGTHIPVTLFHHKDLKKEGSNPLLLHVYGNDCIFFPFSFSKLALLTRKKVSFISGTFEEVLPSECLLRFENLQDIVPLHCLLTNVLNRKHLMYHFVTYSLPKIVQFDSKQHLNNVKRKKNVRHWNLPLFFHFN